MRTEIESAFDDQLFHVMRVVFQEHTARWNATVPGLTKPQYAVLSALDAKPGIEQNQLVTAAATSKATLAEMLVRLESRGLIRREIDAGDSRRRLVYLTEDGRRLLRRVSPLADTLAEEILAPLTRTERATLLDLMRRIRHGACAS